MDRVLLVANPTSGGGRARRILPGAVSALRSLGIDHRVVVTGDGAHGPEVAAEAAQGGVRALVAVGGDGLVGTCAAALAGTGTVLAVVPAGTGNDLARNLGLDARHPFRSLSCVPNPHSVRVCPVLVAGGWTPLPGRAMMVAVGNATSSGGGMRVCPDALLDDGLVDVCVVGAMPKLEFAATFPKVFRGTHVDHPAVHLVRGRHVELWGDRPFRVYGDGEPLGHLPVTFTVDPGSLEVAAP